MTIETIGFIGLGTMGAPIAANLLRAGFKVRGFDLDPARAKLLPGLEVANTAIECVNGVDIVMTSLPGPRQFLSLMESKGFTESLKPGSLFIDLTTNDPAIVRQYDILLAGQDVHLLDSPVTGAVNGAISGELTIFSGGRRSDFDRALPILNAVSAKAIHCGAIGAGNVVKLVTNQLWFIHAAALGEGLLLGKKGGVDLAVLWDAIKSSVGTSFVAEHDAPSIFAGHYDPSFTLDLCAKDLGLITSLAHSLSVPVPLTECTQGRFLLARESYGGAGPEYYVTKLLEDEAKTDLRIPGDWGSHWSADPTFAPIMKAI